MEKSVGIEEALLISETANDVHRFLEFDEIIKLGVQIPFDKIPFERAMMFSWIKKSRES